MSQVENLKPSPFSNFRGGFIINKVVLLVLIFVCYLYLTAISAGMINFALAIGLLAVASSFVMAGGNIDLGMPFNCLISFVISNVIYTNYQSAVEFVYFNELALVCGIIGATLTGYITGVVITKKSIPVYLASFSMPAIIFYILYLLLGNNQGIDLFLAHNTLPVLADSSLYIMIGVGIVLSILFAYSKFGKNLRATGSSFDGAVEAGIDTVKSIQKSYVLSGFLCGIAGIIIKQTPPEIMIAFMYPVLSWLPVIFLGALFGNNKFSGGKLDVLGSFLGGIFAVLGVKVLLIFTNSYEQVLAVVLLAILISIMATSKR